MSKEESSFLGWLKCENLNYVNFFMFNVSQKERDYSKLHWLLQIKKFPSQHRFLCYLNILSLDPSNLGHL